MNWFWGVLGFVVLIIWIVTIVDIVGRHLGAKKTVAWLLIVILLPVLGAGLYWVLKRPSEADLEATVGARSDLRHDRPRGGMGGSSGGGTRPGV